MTAATSGANHASSLMTEADATRGSGLRSESSPSSRRAASMSLRILSFGVSITTVELGVTLRVSQTLEPITESWPMTVLPPRIVALA